MLIFVPDRNRKFSSLGKGFTQFDEIILRHIVRIDSLQDQHSLYFSMISHDYALSGRYIVPS